MTVHATHPRPPVPVVVAATGAVLGCGAALALALHWPPPPTFAAFVAIAAMVPWRSSGPLRRFGVAAAYGSLAWSIFGLLPMVTIGWHLPGPYGGHAGSFLFVLVASVLRLLALEGEGARVWCSPRWVLGTSAPVVLPARDALIAALARPNADREASVDAAVVALAAAGPDQVPTDDAERRAFFVDAYNVLALHARRDRESPRVASFVESYRVRYEVCGSTLSPDQIEHAILRGNRRHPSWLSGPFPEHDERRKWVVPLDPRVHFALNCGMKSCPPIRSYLAAGDSDALLAEATAHHVSDATEIDVEARTLATTALFRFYWSDFGGEAGVRATIAGALGRPPSELEGLALSWRKYDFGRLHRFA